MGRTIGRKEISEVIHERIGGSVPVDEIYTATRVIIDELLDLLGNGEPVTAKNFGTLSPYLYRAHLAVNVNSGLIEMTRAFRSVRFHPAVAFDELLLERKECFSKNG